MSKGLDRQLYDMVDDAQALKQDIADRKKDEQIIIAAREAECVAWVDELFYIRFSNGEIETKSYIAITYGEWQERKRSMGL